MHVLKKFIIASTILHLVLLACICWFGSGSHALKRRYVVFGAHTARPKQVTYKSSHLFNSKMIGKNIGNRAGGRRNAKGAVHGKGKTRQTQKKVVQKTRSKTNAQKRVVPQVKTKNVAQQKGPTIKDLAKKKAVQKKQAQTKMAQKRLAQKRLAQKKIEQEKRAQKKLEQERLAQKKIERETKAQQAKEKKRELVQREALARKKLEEELKQQAEQEERQGAEQDESDIETSSVDAEGPLLAMNENDGPIEVPVYANSVQEAEINVNAAVYQKNIQQEVERLWHPPVGVSKGTTCTLFIEVNMQGKVSKADLVTRSRVLIYDLSVIKIAKKFAFNQSLWGKQFKIDFRQ